MKSMMVATIVLAMAFAANATVVSYGWEDGGTILTEYPAGQMFATNVSAPDPVYAGAKSLKLVDNAPSGTPQAYLAWITGLQTGDIVTASFYVYDTTPSGAPSGRIWGHWNDTPDLTGFSGSAGGNNDYGPSNGWAELSWSWTVAANTGLVIEARTYSNPGDTVYLDNLKITVPDHARVTLPVPEPVTLVMLAFGGLMLRRR